MVQLYLLFFIFFGMIGSLYADENQDNAKLTNDINATIQNSQATLSADLAAKQQDISADISKQIEGERANTTPKKDDGKLTIITSEAVPGADCSCKDTVNQCTVVTTRKYECTTNKGMLGFQEVFAKIIRYVINIVLLLGVLAVVGLGIAWSFAGGDDVKAKSTLKTWAINIVIGLLILFMFRYILLFLAPWIYR